MGYLSAGLSGLVLGTLGAYLNYRITLSAIKKGTTKALSISNSLHTVVNIAVLALIFLIRNILPFDFIVCMVGATIALSIVGIIFSFKAAKIAKISAPQSEESENDAAPENVEPQMTDELEK